MEKLGATGTSYYHESNLWRERAFLLAKALIDQKIQLKVYQAIILAGWRSICFLSDLLLNDVDAVRIAGDLN